MATTIPTPTAREAHMESPPVYTNLAATAQHLVPQRRGDVDEPLLMNSRIYETPGPSNKDPAFITSTWGIGWQTPTLMIASYLLALSLALAHLLFFRYIDGKQASGPQRIISQSYVTTISNILANVFGYSLKGGLALAFVQYLWYLLRVQNTKVSTIELLFSIRSNPFVLLDPSAIKATPVLFSLAVVMWVMQFVISFPPGAIIVTTSYETAFVEVRVPTFDASFMGNGSGVEANAYSLSILSPDPPFGFTTDGSEKGLTKNSNIILRLASQVLVSGEALAMPSPCGTNCSYTISFDGPYFDCSSVSTDIFYNNTRNVFAMYNGSWFDPRSSDIQPPYNGSATMARFRSSTLTPIEANADAFYTHSGNLNGTPVVVYNGSMLMQQDSLTCVPSRATFMVNHTYVNNVHSTLIKRDSIEPLTNLAPLTKDNAVLVPGFSSDRPPSTLDGGIAYGTKLANWSTSAMVSYRDNNLMAIFGAMMLELEGGFLAAIEKPSTLNLSAPDRSMRFKDLKWSLKQQTVTAGGSSSRPGSLNGTIIDSTRFNTAFGQFSALEAAPPAIFITEDLLNDYLLNMTTSIMMAYENWQTTTNATVSSLINVYSFSRPLSLILPYSIVLVLAVLFMLLGGVALLRNGVSAMDGSFTQIITTTTGSALLDQAAAGGCLGGSESMPQELKDIKIRFGEIIERADSGRIRRAGFGTETEIAPLTKGGAYGVARWI